MNIQTSKIELVKLILSIENENLITKIKEFVQNEKIDFWDELSLFEKKEIEQGIKQLDNGKRVEFDTFLKKNL